MTCCERVQTRRPPRPSVPRRDRPQGSGWRPRGRGWASPAAGDPEHHRRNRQDDHSARLSEDPHDFLATHLLHATGTLTGSALSFGAIYLLAHGVIKIVLVAALLRNQIWAYPWMIGFLIAFILYQLYRLTFGFSVVLVGLTVFDAVVVWLTAREYQRQRAHPTPSPAVR